MHSSKHSLIYSAIILVLMTISARATDNMVTTTVPLLAKYSLQLSNSLVELLSALLFTFNFITTTFINPELNSRVRRRVFVISNVIILFSLPLYYLSNEISIWIISIFAGIAFGLVMPNLITAASLANDKKSVERLLSLYSTSLSTSLILGPAIEVYLLTKYDYRDVFLWFIPIAVIGIIISSSIRFPDVKRESSGISVIKNKGLTAAALSITTYNVLFAAFTTFLAILAKDRFNLPNFDAYFVFLPFYIMSFLTRLTMTIRPFENLRMPMLISIIITILGLFGILYAPNYSIFLAVIALLGIPHGSIFPMATIMISRATSIAERNAVNSYFLAYNNLLFLVVPATIGFVSEIVGLSLSISALIIPVAITAVAFFKMFWNDNIMVKRCFVGSFNIFQ
ncbi:major facilitator superfamily MFS_1 [Sulfolobus islandicus Y.N.15.51]|uniref:Major facilitator superfamily MFS_1 n=1 Tax=Saccharolobus islandicus (strain Y.N.15.51 / Yellowstone \|nr:MFS transporter [Sulfolobus islandicus]ACP48945.1 major facilitator superfamily MFS_1 [Sulfolobus islandicus Y.N.15.51]